MIPIRNAQREIEIVHAEMFAERIAKRKQRTTNGHSPSPTVHINLDDATLLDKARNAKTGSDFIALYDRGDTSGYGNDDSRADFALICTLLFWTGGKADQAERLFSASALGQRDKWRNRPGYRELTIENAVRAQTHFYDFHHIDQNMNDANGATRSNQANHESEPENAHSEAEPEVPVQYSDTALRNRFAAEQGQNIRHIAMLNTWLHFREDQGCRWIPDQKKSIELLMTRFLTKVSQEMYRNAVLAAQNNPGKAEEIIKAAKTLAKKLTSAKQVADVIKLTCSHPSIAAVHSQFDSDPWLLNAQGIVIDLRTGTQRPAERNDYFTKATRVIPRDEPTPVYDKFVREIMGSLVTADRCKWPVCRRGDKHDPELHQEEVSNRVVFFERIYGKSLSGSQHEQKLVIQIGDGGNGKGTANDFISQDIFGTAALGGYSTELPVEALLDNKSDRHPTELMDLRGARLALARESDEDTRWNEGKVKRLTGGDRIKARLMRQDFIEFDPTHQLIVFGNANPTLRGADQAAWKRRLVMWDFPQLWDDKDKADDKKGILERDTELRTKLQTEAPGVLNRFIRACANWYRERDLKIPASIRAGSDQYLTNQNTLLQFVEDCYDRSNPYATITVSEVWPEYLGWCEARNEYSCKRNQFNGRLEKLGLKITNTEKHRGVISGLKKKAETDSAD